MIKRGSGDADSAGFSQRLQSGRNIDTIAIDTTVFLNDVSKVNPNTKLHFSAVCKLGVQGFELFLYGHCCLYAINDTGKLCQQIIPRRIHHSAVMLTDEFGHNVTVSVQSSDSHRLIISHETTVIFHVSTENSCELAFETVSGHSYGLRRAQQSWTPYRGGYDLGRFTLEIKMEA